jgi:hypothetical protein
LTLSSNFINNSFTPTSIQFTVEVLQPLPRDVIDFMLETTTTSGENVALGAFLFETPVAEPPDDGEGLFKQQQQQLVMTSTTVSMESDSVESSDQNDCERNVVYHKFTSEDDKVIFNWTTGGEALMSESNFVNFR